MRGIIHAAILAAVLSATGCIAAPEPAEPVKAVKAFHETIYDNIVIEVQPIEGVEPTRQTFTILIELFEKYKICKKENVLIIFKYSIKGHKIVSWSNQAVHTFENSFRAISDDNLFDRNFSVFVSYLPGKYSVPGMENVAGLRYNWSSVAVFGNYSGRPGANLLLHEFGHLLTMVNHKNRVNDPINPARPRHCNNRRCVMFWQWNKEAGFCDLCVKDLDKLLSLQNGPY